MEISLPDRVISEVAALLTGVSFAFTCVSFHWDTILSFHRFSRSVFILTSILLFVKAVALFLHVWQRHGDIK
jgi:hypothetical protein